VLSARPRYDEEHYLRCTLYFETVGGALSSTHRVPFDSLLMAVAAKLKVADDDRSKMWWLHFLSLYGMAADGQSERIEGEAALFLLSLVRECVLSPSLVANHLLFRSPRCVMVRDAMRSIVVHFGAAHRELFRRHLNDQTVETLLGMVDDPEMTDLLQEYHSLNEGMRALSVDAAATDSKQQPLSSATNRGGPATQSVATPMHRARYQALRKQQIESMATPPLNMYCATPSAANALPTNQRNSGGKENEHRHRGAASSPQQSFEAMADDQLAHVLLTANPRFIRCTADEKSALKVLSHRITKMPKSQKGGKASPLDALCPQILRKVLGVLNEDRFVLHRNALRIVQAMCWQCPRAINEEMGDALLSIVGLFRGTAPAESGELALDVITQFCLVVQPEKCMAALLPLIERLAAAAPEDSRERKVFAALSIFDRVVVVQPPQWTRERLPRFQRLLLAAYKYHREAMRSLIYLAIITEDGRFLDGHPKEQRIVEMMAKEQDFVQWVRSHRVRHTPQPR